MIPCLAYSGGKCQDALILVELLAVTLKPLGACEGTEIKKCDAVLSLFFGKEFCISRNFVWV